MRAWIVIALAAAAVAQMEQAIGGARTLIEFPVNTFLESVVVRPDGSLLVSSYPDGKIYAVEGAEKRLFAQVGGTIAGLALQPDGTVLVSGWIDGKRPAVFRVSAAGKPRLLVELRGGMFPNGFCHLGGDRYLLADSYRGAIWEVDAKEGRAHVWLEHALLARADEKNPAPGVNGLKIFGDALYASNTQAQRVVRIPLRVDRPGTPEIFVEGVNIDDFAFDANGNLYGATHVQDGVVRIDRSGKVAPVAGRDSGLAGSTAVAFGRGADQSAIFVTTNGGMSNPPPGGVQPGRIVRIEVGSPGAPLRR